MMKLKVTEPPVCPHCGERMVHYDLPPVTFADGLGWGTTFLWVCPSDDCPIFRKGFEHTLSHYGQTTTMRSIIEPDSGRASVVPAFSMDTEHFETFEKTRKDFIAKMRRKPAKPPQEMDQDDGPDDDPYDPERGFTES